ncbi:MAG: hypothetical protein HQL51_05710 [Magnetococcales bacterium]|nr:hypothetical protein [Magnetococcales bacterium]
MARKSTRSPDAPPPSLEEVMSHLRTIPDQTRVGFLTLAEHMGAFSGNFATGSSRATSIRERIESNGALGLTPLNEDLKRAFRETKLAFTALDELVARKESFIEGMEAVARWGLTLEQDAYLPPLSDQFRGGVAEALEIQTLGSIIDNLMQQIRPLIQEMISASQGAAGMLGQLSRRLASDLGTSRNSLTRMQKSLSTALASMSGAVNTLNETCLAMEDRSRHVGGVVFEMVQSMQYDDITVQRVDHCLTVLEMARSKWSAVENREQNRKWFLVALKLVIDQIEETGVDLVTAVQSLHARLSRISDLAVEQSKGIGRIRQESMNFRQDAADLVYHLSTLLRLPIFDDNLSSEVLRTLSQTENAVFQAKRALSALVMLSARLETLAGSLRNHHSERLEILADSILDITRRIQGEGRLKEKELTLLAALLNDLGLAYSEKATPRLMRANSMLRRAPLATQMLETNSADILTVMNASLSDAQSVIIQIMLLTAELTFHTKVNHAIEQAVREMSQILRTTGGAEVDALVGDPLGMAREFADLLALYTMESERRIHKMLLKNAEGEEGEEEGEEEESDGFELF